MGFLAKLTKAFGGTTEASGADTVSKELAALYNDGRVHPRYLINGEGVARLQLDNGLEGVVHDASYGGVAVRFNERLPATLSAPLPATCKGTLWVLDRSVSCSLLLVRHVLKGSVLFAGFTIQHETSETLIFMRELIEPLRSGKSFVALDRSTRHERYQGEDWSCLRGDGPSDLLIRTTPDQTLVEALLTYRSGEAYCELSFKDNVLRTGRSVPARQSTMTVGATMAATDSIDKAILQHAIFLLLGAPAECRMSVRPLLDLALNRASMKLEEPAA